MILIAHSLAARDRTERVITRPPRVCLAFSFDYQLWTARAVHVDVECVGVSAASCVSEQYDVSTAAISPLMAHSRARIHMNMNGAHRTACAFSCTPTAPPLALRTHRPHFE